MSVFMAFAIPLVFAHQLANEIFSQVGYSVPDRVVEIPVGRCHISQSFFIRIAQEWRNTAEPAPKTTICQQSYGNIFVVLTERKK